MLNSNSYKKARTNRMVVEELTKETEIDLFVMDGHKKIVDENVKFLAPSLIHKAIEYIWKGTNKLSREVKLAIEYFKIDEIVNRDGSSLVSTLAHPPRSTPSSSGLYWLALISREWLACDMNGISMVGLLEGILPNNKAALNKD